MALLLVAWSQIYATDVAARDGMLAPILFQYLGTQVAQQSYGSGSNSRMLAPPSWQAAQAARNCAPGGTMIKFEATGNGYNATFDFGNRVVVVRVDRNGRCR